jgi:hypothetical protein
MIDLEIATTEAFAAIGLILTSPGMRAALVGVDDPRWVRNLRLSTHDFYHHPTYVALDAAHQRGEPRALVVEASGKFLLLPLVIRSVPGGGMDAVSPYGYPGPVIHGTKDPEFVSEALSVGIELLRFEGIVSLFVRLHPILNPTPPTGVGTVIRHGHTIAVDLAQPEELQWTQTRRDHRRAIRRSERAGHRVRVDTTWEHLATFKQLYRKTMKRVGAAPYYFFDDTYFDGMRAAFPGRAHLVLVEVDGHVATAAIEVETCGIMQDHLAGTDERFLQFQPEKLMINFVRQWAKQRGNRWLHLGGGVGGNADSLLKFKQGFSPVRSPFHTLRVVVRESEYRRLVVARDPQVDPFDLSGFFPAYRDR